VHVVLNTFQANVLICNGEPPRARLTDFGLNAVMFDSFSMSRTSVNWVAPEIFAPGEQGYRLTFASDIYALGMAIYEVTGLACDSVLY
jgi:serine/threonine protein kinase